MLLIGRGSLSIASSFNELPSHHNHILRTQMAPGRLVASSPSDVQAAHAHASMTYSIWKALQSLTHGKKVELNGHDLDIASVVAVSK